MRLPEACESCPIKNFCTTHEPINRNGHDTEYYIGCLKYTCGDGVRAAVNALRKARRNNSWATVLTTEGKKTKLVRFGTDHKPTHKGSFARYLDYTDGRIYFQSRGFRRRAYPTGQSINQRAYISQEK